MAKSYDVPCGGVNFPIYEYNGYKFAGKFFYKGFDIGKMEEYMDAIKNMEIRDDDVILLTYPKSGTHLLREIIHMLQIGRTEYIGADVLDFPIEYRDPGEMASLESPRTMHSHAWYSMLPKQITKDHRGKVIALIRNPKDVCVSFWHFAAKTEQQQLPLDVFVDNFIKGNFYCGSWYDWRNELVRGRKEDDTPPILVITYEDCVNNIRDQIRKIAAHMEKKVSDKFIDDIAKACKITSMREGKRRNQPEDVSKHFIEGYDIFYRKGTHLLREIIHMLQVGRIEYIGADVLDFPIEYRDPDEVASLKSPRTMHSHLWYSMLPKQLTKEHRGKIIALLRNPKDVCASYWYFMCKAAKLQLPLDVFVDNFLRGNFYCGSWWDWRDELVSGLSKDDIPSILILTYEDCVQNIREQIRKIAAYMDKDVSDKFIDDIAAACEITLMREGKRRNQPEDVSKHSNAGYDIFYRKGVVGDWKNTFTVNIDEIFNQWIQSQIDDNVMEIPNYSKFYTD